MRNRKLKRSKKLVERLLGMFYTIIASLEREKQKLTVLQERNSKRITELAENNKAISEHIVFVDRVQANISKLVED